MRRLFIDVDTQNDFLCNDKIYVDPLIPYRIKRLVKYAMAERIPIIGSVDSHEHDVWFTNLLSNSEPVHCVKGTWGWLKIQDTLPDRAVFVSFLDPDHAPCPIAPTNDLDKELFLPGALPSMSEDTPAKISVATATHPSHKFAQGFYLEKMEGTLFNNPMCTSLLDPFFANGFRKDRTLQEEFEVVIFGVAVKETAMDFLILSKDFAANGIPIKIKVVSNATVYRGNKERHDSDRELMESAGVVFVEASEFIGEDRVTAAKKQ